MSLEYRDDAVFVRDLELEMMLEQGSWPSGPPYIIHEDNFESLLHLQPLVMESRNY